VSANNTFFIKVGQDKYTIYAVVTVSGCGINVYIGGGEKPHIGTVAISQPRLSLKGDGNISCTTSVFNLLGHKDDYIAVPVAEDLCKKTNQTVVVSAGVHIENAAQEDIEKIKMLAEELNKKIAEKLSYS
jgi:hypothetical protein